MRVRSRGLVLILGLVALAAGCGGSAGDVRSSGLAGNTDYVVTGAGALVETDDWACVTFVDRDTGKLTGQAECAPLDGSGIDLYFDAPAIAGEAEPIDAIFFGASTRAHLIARRHGRNVYSFSFGPLEANSVWKRASRAFPKVAASQGLRFPTSTWRCAARSEAPNLVCYRLSQGVAHTPIVRIYPARRVVEIESVDQPTLMAIAGTPGTKSVTYSYTLDK